MPTLIDTLSYLGVFVFALSGSLAAARARMDIFGCAVLGLMPAVGGGTIRDVVLNVPVFWIEQSVILLVVGSAAVLVYFGSRFVESRQRLILWADAFGLALFSVLGTSKALDLTDDFAVAVMLGVTTGVAGGIIRDVIVNEVPLILEREIYAIAALAGAVGYAAMVRLGLEPALAMPTAVALTFLVRAAAILWSWSLPPAKR